MFTVYIFVRLLFEFYMHKIKLSSGNKAFVNDLNKRTSIEISSDIYRAPL